MRSRRASTASGVRWAPPRIQVLVLDDHLDSAEMVAESLELRAISARIGSILEARELLASFAPDLRLPDGRGEHFARDLRLAHPDRRPRIVGVSGVTEPGTEILRYLDAYLQEPIDLEVLGHLVLSLAPPALGAIARSRSRST